MIFENGGLRITAKVHATYTHILFFDHKVYKSVNYFTNILADKKDLLAIFDAITKSSVIQESIDIITVNPIDSSISKIVVAEHEFVVNYDWLKQVFKRILAESLALED